MLPDKKTFLDFFDNSACHGYSSGNKGVTTDTINKSNYKCRYNINNDNVYLYIAHQKQCANMFNTEQKIHSHV